MTEKVGEIEEAEPCCDDFLDDFWAGPGDSDDGSPFPYRYFENQY